MQTTIIIWVLSIFVTFLLYFFIPTNILLALNTIPALLGRTYYLERVKATRTKSGEIKKIKTLKSDYASKIVPLIVLIVLIISPLIIYIYENQPNESFIFAYNFFKSIYPKIFFPSWSNEIPKYAVIVLLITLCFYGVIMISEKFFSYNRYKILSVLSKVTSYLTSLLFFLALLQMFFIPNIIEIIKENIISYWVYNLFIVFLPFMTTSLIIFLAINSIPKILGKRVISD